MKEIRYSSKAKKDLKRLRGKESFLRELYHVLTMLQRGERLPASYYPHILKGQYSGMLECHVENDLLLIWIEDDSIFVVRIGTHSELF